MPPGLPNAVRWPVAGGATLALTAALTVAYGLAPRQTAVVALASGAVLALRVATRVPARHRRVAGGATSLAAAGLFTVTGVPTHPLVTGAVAVAVLEWGRAIWAASAFEWPDRQASHPFAAGGAAMGPLGAVSASIVEALEGSPSTRRELGTAVEADADSLDRALNELQARGLVVRAGREYRIAEDGPPTA